MTGNIIGEPITEEIDNQIKFRQQIHGAGYIPGTQNLQRTPEVQNYLNNRNAWIKMASGVSLSGSVAVEKIKGISSDEGGYLTDTEIANIQGTGLAERIILFNSTQKYDKTTKSYDKRSGARTNNSFTDSIDKMYGGLGSNQRGLQPVPGITGISIECLNRGSIRKATVNLKAYNKFQFGLIELLYLRLGYLMMLEWGWDKYIEKIEPGKNAISPPIVTINDMGSTIIENQWFNGNNYSQTDMLNLTLAYQDKYKGNYGGFFGKVSNFQWKLNSDNTYDITVNLITLGSVIESLNIKIPEFNIEKLELLQRKEDLGKEIGLESIKEVEESDNVILTNIGSDRLNQWLSTTIINFGALKTKTTADETKDYIFGRDLVGVDVGGKSYRTTWIDNIPKESQYFVRFGAFLTILQKLAIVNVINGSSTSDRELVFEQDTESVRCNYQMNLVPLNANKVIFSPLMEQDFVDAINKDVEKTPLQSFKNQIAEFATKKDDVVYGKLLNCYLNLTFIQQAFLDATNSEEEVGLFEFLQEICKGINESTGNCTNLEVIIKKDKTIVIIDQNQIKGGDKLIAGFKETTPINIYGYNPNGSSSFVKNFDFKTKITPNLANMVTIGATASDDKGINAIPFKKWNQGLSNRFGLSQQYDQKPTAEEKSKEKDKTIKEAFASDVKDGTAGYNSGVGYYWEFADIEIKGIWAEGVSWVSNRGRDSVNQELLSIALNKYKDALVNYDNDWETGNPESKIYKNSVEAENNYLVYLTKAFGGDSGYKIGQRYMKNNHGDPEYTFKTKKIKTTRKDGLYFKWDNNDFIQQGKNSFKKYMSNINKEEALASIPIISGAGFIPLELGITMEGLTGIRIYNRLNINTKFLPSSYPKNLKFIIKGVNHKISNNIWDTNLSTISIPVSGESSTKKEASRAEEAATAVNSSVSYASYSVKRITNAQQKNNIQVVATYLKEAGVTRDGAKGLIGNLLGESTLDPAIVERVRADAGYTTSSEIGGKGGFGIAQWTGQRPGERRKQLEAAAGGNLAKRNSLDFQSEFLIKELKNKYFSVFQQLKSSNSIEKSTIIVLEKFEVPGSYITFKENPSSFVAEQKYNATKNKRIALALRAGEDVDKIYNA